MGYFDYKNSISRDVLDHDFKRANPSEWGQYTLSRELIRIFNSGCPQGLYMRLEENSYVLSRPTRVRFFDSSTFKIGRQAIGNRVLSLVKNLAFDWHVAENSPDLIT